MSDKSTTDITGRRYESVVSSKPVLGCIGFRQYDPQMVDEATREHAVKLMKAAAEGHMCKDVFDLYRKKQEAQWSHSSDNSVIDVSKLLAIQAELKKQIQPGPYGVFVSPIGKERLRKEATDSTGIFSFCGSDFVLAGMRVEADPELAGNQIALCPTEDGFKERLSQIEAGCASHIGHNGPNGTTAGVLYADGTAVKNIKVNRVDFIRVGYTGTSDEADARDMFHQHAFPKLEKARKISAKAAAYQARKYVARIVRRERRKDRMRVNSPKMANGGKA